MGRKPYTSQQMKDIVDKMSEGKIELLDRLWRGKYATYECRCKVHDWIWTPHTQWQSLSSKGSSCPLCAKEKRNYARKNSYSPKEDQILRDNYILSDTLISELLLRNRTAKSIAKRRSSLGMMKMPEQRGVSRMHRHQHEGIVRREKLRGIVPDEWFDLPASPGLAKEQNEIFYFTGEECNVHGHTIGYAVNRACIECIKTQAIARRRTEEGKEYWRTYQEVRTILDPAYKL